MKDLLVHHSQRQPQAGQTLVETLVASLVLSIGIGAAISLAVYGLSATSGVSKQIIAVGLAREGLEAVRNMRDTNWLRGTLVDTCYNHYTGGSDAFCYSDWLSGGTYNLYPPLGNATYFLSFDASDPDEYEYWRLVPTSSLYGLNYTPGNIAGGLYSTDGLAGVPVSTATSGFARRVSLSLEDSTPPFDQSTGPRLKVSVDVWWNDRRCPAMTTDPADSGSCRLTLETYLTNWKDY